MKNTDKIYPVVFFIFGIILIGLVSGVSIKNYIKQSKDIKQVSVSNKQKESAKIFFNKPQNDPENTSLKVYKSKKIMEVYGDGKLIGRFKIGLGRVNKGPKEKEGDNKTPEGSYYICYINPNSKYKDFFGISYPNEKDAKNGLDKNIINKITYNRVKDAMDDRRQPPWHTALGGQIGIHGGGTTTDWTYGCVTMNDEDIYKVKEYIRLKTEVDIYK